MNTQELEIKLKDLRKEYYESNERTVRLNNEIINIKEKIKKKKELEFSYPCGNYYLTSSFGVGHSSSSTTCIRGNSFKTCKDAEDAAKIVKLTLRMWHLAKQVNEGWEPDWVNHDENKHQIVFDWGIEEFKQKAWCYSEALNEVYFKNQETAEKAIKMIEANGWLDE